MKNFGDIFMLQRALETLQNQPPSYHVANILKFKFAPVFFCCQLSQLIKTGTWWNNAEKIIFSRVTNKATSSVKIHMLLYKLRTFDE